MRIDVDKQLRMLERGVLPRLEIPDARYRVGAFAFEDPDRTGLGNALAAILAREILIRSDVGSIGVLRFEGGLSPPAGGGLSYFDKVESVGTAQQASETRSILRLTAYGLNCEFALSAMSGTWDPRH